MVKSLTKITKDGKPYIRPHAVEVNIEDALSQDLDTVLGRARIRDRNDPEYLCSECLLHLVRNARLQGETRKVERLLPFLLKRCEALLKAAIPDGGRGNAADMREDILQSFCELLARVGTPQDTGTLDYFEIRFNHALTTLRFKRLAREDRRRKNFDDIPQVKDEDGEPLDDENILARVSSAAQSPARQENYVFLIEVFKLINALPVDEREAVILCYVKGYKVESEDPDEVTAATLCNVSGRTIRKRLEKAAAKLKQ